MEIVIGDKDAKLKYFKSKGVDTSQIEAEDGKKKDDSTSKKIIIDVDSAEPLTEEELRMLTRTRNRHDPHEVYMQSDVSFYDAFYSSSDDLDGELSEEAHRIRRVYKNYKEYLMAMDIRDQYIEMLLDEKFGGDVEKFKLTMGVDNPPYWVPPMPICTRSARKKATVGNRYDPYGQSILYQMKSLVKERWKFWHKIESMQLVNVMRTVEKSTYPYILMYVQTIALSRTSMRISMNRRHHLEAVDIEIIFRASLMISSKGGTRMKRNWKRRKNLGHSTIVKMPLGNVT